MPLRIHNLLINYYHLSLQPLAHFFVTSPAKQDLLTKSLQASISKVTEVGLLPCAITMDQEPIHQRLSRDMGGHIISIPILFDPPHLLKSTRNCLLSNKIMVSKQTDIHFGVSHFHSSFFTHQQCWPRYSFSTLCFYCISD